MNEAATIVEAFQRTAAVSPDTIALRTPRDGQTMSWRDYAAQVREVAAGLAGLGLGRGDTVALMMGNRLEFYPLEVGAQHVGATSFSAYNSLSVEQLAFVFGNAGNEIVICEEQYVEKIKATDVAFKYIVCIDGNPDGTITVEDLKAAAPADFDFEATWRAVQPDDVVTLIYTSGTTGPPKGVEITQESLLFGLRAIDGLTQYRYGDRMMSYLPTAHIADRFTALYVQETFGTQVTVVGDFREISTALPDTSPTVFGAVPRVWEKLKIGIEGKVAAEPRRLRKSLATWALAAASQKADAALRNEELRGAKKVRYTVADKLVLTKLRRAIGMADVRWAVSAGAPVPVETLAFFAGLGVPIAEVWGMTELGAMATASPAGQGRLGTVGKILPGMEYRIAKDGEFLVRGPLVMKGYRKEPEKTAEAITPDGWLMTGDVMTVDDEGYVRIVDRKKELIISANGKNMSPANIENTIKAACPLAGSVAAIGDAQPYNTALIVLDAEGAGYYAREHGLSDASAPALAQDANVIAAIAAGVAEGNTKLSKVEQIKRFTVLPTFWEPGGEEITNTMKLKRKPIAVKYAGQIERLYAADRPADVYEPRPA